MAATHFSDFVVFHAHAHQTGSISNSYLASISRALSLSHRPRSDSTLRTFSFNSARPVATRRLISRVSALALTKSGDAAVFGGDATALTLCRVHDLQILREIHLDCDSPVWSLAFSDDRDDHHHLFVGTEDGSLLVVARSTNAHSAYVDERATVT